MKNYDKPRQALKKAGWKRMDRHNEEYWESPWNGIGLQPGLYTFKRAWNKYTKDKRETQEGREFKGKGGTITCCGKRYEFKSWKITECNAERI